MARSISEQTIACKGADWVQIAFENPRRRFMMVNNPSTGQTIYMAMSPQPPSNYQQGEPVYPGQTAFIQPLATGECEWLGAVYIGCASIQNITVQEAGNG